MTASPGSDDVDRWLDEQTHALVDDARLVWATILRAVPAAVESIKWKAPNFALGGVDFATFSLRRPGVLQLILHTGVSPRPDHPAITLPPVRGLRWADHNRAVITITEQGGVPTAEIETAVEIWSAGL
jgi:hypothetical protein